MKLPLALGRVFAGSGQGASLSNWLLGQSNGEETHTMTLAELVSHVHTGNGTIGVGAAAGGGEPQFGAVTTSPVSTTITTPPAGGGSPFNIIQPTTHLNYYIKL